MQLNKIKLEDALKLLVILLFFGLTGCASTHSAQGELYDFLLKGGHVIDPKNDIDDQMDVAVKDGSIAFVADDISVESAETVVNATGLYVTPGLIDIHNHHFHGTEPGRYLSNSFTALPPDGLISLSLKNR